MTKYEIVDNVSRYVRRFGMIMDPETMNLARDEGDEYDYRLISPGHYGVIHGKKMYVIIERDGEIGCSCDDMTYNRMDGSACKHIIKFSRLTTPVTREINKLDAYHLMHVCGWTGKELHPEIELGEPGAVIQESMAPDPKEPKKIQIPADPDLDLGVDDPLPEPEPEVKVSVKCQYCGMGATRKDQKAADSWLKKHEAGCAKNPANQKDASTQKPSEKEKSPEPEPKTPPTPRKVRQPEPEPNTALSTGHDMSDEREFTTDKVRRYVENRGGFYKAAGGKEVPDSAAMSLYALDSCRISTETILIEKNADQAKAIVRGYKGDVYVDASVILRFEVLRRRELLKMAKKYPKAILDWSDQMMPNLDLNFKLADRTPIISLGEHMINFAIDQEHFAERTAETLARRRVFDMLTGVDWRDAVEVQLEDDDAASMGSKKG